MIFSRGDKNKDRIRDRNKDKVQAKNKDQNKAEIPTKVRDKIQQLSDYIDESEYMIAITGAGISVSGGGVTYGQLSRSMRPGFGGRRGSGNRDDSFLYGYRDAMLRYQPSYSHYALRDLETDGRLKGIITTNEDCMHTLAGSKNVAEIQGSFQINPGRTEFDRIADLNFKEASDDVFKKLKERRKEYD